MRCRLCGARTDSPTEIQFAGYLIEVCSNCTEFGTAVQDASMEDRKEMGEGLIDFENEEYPLESVGFDADISEELDEDRSSVDFEVEETEVSVQVGGQEESHYEVSKELVDGILQSIEQEITDSFQSPSEGRYAKESDQGSVSSQEDEPGPGGTEIYSKKQDSNETDVHQKETGTEIYDTSHGNEGETEPYTEATEDSSLSYCPSCGYRLSGEPTFCSSCGQNLSEY